MMRLTIPTLALLAGAFQAEAQDSAPPVDTSGTPSTDSSPAPVAEAPLERAPAVPFAPGERATYRVDLGIFGEVGRGEMNVLGVEDVRGHDTYHLRLRIRGGVLFAKVDDNLESWLDVNRLISLRYHQDQDEVNYEKKRTFDFFPEEGVWRILRTGEEGPLGSTEPLDEVSFLYFVRTLPLEVGETYTFPRYYKEGGNPVTLRVLRRETISVPAGRFNTIVVQPIIKSRGLFGEGGKAEVYFTDDDRRLLVMMKSKVPVVGSLSLHLQTYSPGTPVSASR